MIKHVVFGMTLAGLLAIAGGAGAQTPIWTSDGPFGTAGAYVRALAINPTTPSSHRAGRRCRPGDHVSRKPERPDLPRRDDAAADPVSAPIVEEARGEVAQGCLPISRQQVRT